MGGRKAAHHVVGLKIFLATPRRAPARLALQARPVPHQRKIPALAAGVTLVAGEAGGG